MSPGASSKCGSCPYLFQLQGAAKPGNSNILGSLIKQICQQLPQLSQVPPQLEHLTSGGRTPSEEELFVALVEMSKQFFQTYLVFDALDECDREIQRELTPDVTSHG
jgi:hypothetical protein